MVSIIVCARNIEENDLHKRNVACTIGCSFEYVVVDNTKNTYSLAAAYMAGVAKAKGDVLVFCHDDLYFLEAGWGVRLEEKFSADEKLGAVGLAGTTYLCAEIPSWVAAGRPFIQGAVLHDIDKKMLMTVYSWEQKDVPVVALDGLFIAIRKSLFKTISFDASTFNGFHFYDLDICMQIRRTHTLVVTRDVLCKHCSGGNIDDNWHHFADRFRAKYAKELPATCVPLEPDWDHNVRFETFDITDKISDIIPV